MSKNDVLIFGMILQADIFENDGHETMEEDEQLLSNSLLKVYGASEAVTDEEMITLEKQLQDDKKKLILEFREKVSAYLKE